MDKRTGSGPNQRDRYSSPRGQSGRGRQNYNPNELDRYNYIDRDIYSSKNHTRSGGQRNSNRGRKKGGGVKKFVLAVFSLLLIVAIGAVVYMLVLSNRLDRSDKGDTTSYVEQPSAAPAWGVISDRNITNILLIGIDKNDDGSDGRSDTNMLISIDNNTKAIHLVSFLRDTYLEIPTVGKTKLNSAFVHGGVALTMQTLENNFRINIDKYISINTSNFEALIDKMGGLDINMDKAVCDAENKNMHCNLKPGVNHLDGRLAMYYARIREIDDDFGRTGRQREVVELMIKKMKTLNPIQVSKIMYDYMPYIKTNLTDPELAYLASIAGPVSNYPMKTMHIPNTGTYKDEKIAGVGRTLVPDLPKNCALLREFLYGSDSSSVSSK